MVHSEKQKTATKIISVCRKDLLKELTKAHKTLFKSHTFIFLDFNSNTRDLSNFKNKQKKKWKLL